MISELDETIRQLLIKAGGFNPSEVDVSFEIPNREWSAGISKPTLNCYLFDIRENRELRQHGMETMTSGKTAFRQRPLVFFDLTYILTAWTRAVEDEHRLLWHTLQTLLRFEKIPVQYLEGALVNLEYPIYARAAMPEGVLKSPGEFWTALENQIKPSLSYVVTMAIARDQLSAGPLVLSTRLVFPWRGGSDERDVWFGGTVSDAKGDPAIGVVVELEGRSRQTVTDQHGRFRMSVPGPGRYHIVAKLGDAVQRREVVISDMNYDISFGKSS
jgi:hypothetical protein